MHYSPQDIQLGANVQAQVDFEAGGQRVGIQYGQPAKQPMSDDTKWLIGGAVGLGVLYLISRNK